MRDEKYWRENDAKFRAVAQNATYQQFEDIVRASHLKPLDKKDKSHSCGKVKSSIWNSISMSSGKKNSHDADTQALAAAAAASSSVMVASRSAATDNPVRNIEEFHAIWRDLEIEERMDLVLRLDDDVIAQVFERELPPDLLGELLHTFLAFRQSHQDIAAIVRILGKQCYNNILFLMADGNNNIISLF